jgi:hypothetical protein
VSAGEALPVASDYGYAALSSSDALATQQAIAGASGTVGPFDLGVWGGLIATVADTTGTAQAEIIYETSADGVTFQTAATFPLWPHTELLLTLPRLGRYAQLRAVVPPAVSGTIGVLVIARPCLAEVVSAGVQALGLSSLSVTVPALGVADLFIYAENLAGVGAQFEWGAGPSGITVQWQGAETGPGFPGGTWVIAADSGAEAVDLQRVIIPAPPFVKVHITNATGSPVAGSLLLTPLFTPTAPTQRNRLDVRAGDGALATLGATTDAVGALTAFGQLRQVAAYVNPLQIANAVPFRAALGAGGSLLIYNPGAGVTLNVVGCTVSADAASHLDLYRGNAGAAVAALAFNNAVMAPVDGLGTGSRFAIPLSGALNCAWIVSSAATNVAGTLYFL